MKTIIGVFLVCLLQGVVLAQTPFNLDSASVYLKTLSVEIGPRPMGSPAERRAMEFALSKFREFGFHESYILPFRSIAAGEPRATNTSSGTAVGILRGTSKRMIVIGGHIDSAGPEIPGANDDGSGSAIVLELARVLSQRKNESTLVFALFGGEESGLIGSRHFVSHFPEIQQVALMLQVDMANGSDWLIPFIDSRGGSSPTWLVKAAYEEFRELGYSGLSFPTHFFTLNSSLPGGGAGSDHESFLEHDIPAIDFTSDMNDPIHTPEDAFENFLPPGLKRSGDLVYKLLERFDGGVPEGKTDHYFLYQAGPFLLFVPFWILQGCLVISLALGVAAALRVWRRQKSESLQSPGERLLPISTGKDYSLPALKLFLLMLVIQSCVWLSENLVGVLKGLRFPWLGDLGGYIVFGFLAGLVGIWIALSIAPKLQFSKNPVRYFVPAAVLLALLVVAMSLVSPKLGFYPATALALLSLAMIVRQPIVRLLLWLASAHFMYHLLFSEGLGLLAFSLSESPRTVGGSVILHLIYIFFFSFWSFPFLLGFAAIRLDAGVDYLWLSRLKTRTGLLILAGAVLVWGGMLTLQPTFTKLWKQRIDIEQILSLDTGKGSAIVRSNEYLGGTKIRARGKDTTISGRATEVVLQEIVAPSEPWITTERSFDSSTKDSATTVALTLRLRSRFRPFTLRVSYASSQRLFDPVSPLAFSETEKTITFRWYSFPDTSLTIPLQFRIGRADSIRESIEAVFIEPLIPVTVTKNGALAQVRSIVRKSGTFAVH
jgi:hypothetical protein